MSAEHDGQNKENGTARPAPGAIAPLYAAAAAASPLRAPTPTEQIRLAAMTKLSISTVRRAFAGAPIYEGNRLRIAEAARKLGVAGPPPAKASTAPAERSA